MIPHLTDRYNTLVKGEPRSALHELDVGNNAGRDGRMRRGGAAGTGGRVTPPSSASSDEEWEVEASGMRTTAKAGEKGGEGDDGEVNGEAVRAALRKWSGQLVVKTVSFAAGFAVMTVGLWGDRGSMAY